MASDTKTSYFAGFFDGEGSCGIYDTSIDKKQAQFRVSLCQNDPRPLYEVQSIFGGSIRPRRRYVNNKLSINYEWYIYGSKAERFLFCIRPFTIVKSEQIDIFLAARKCLCGKGNRKATQNSAGLIEAERVLKALKR